MPLKGYKQTKEHKRKLEQLKKRFKLGHIPWNKGISPTEETKYKLSIANKGLSAGMTGKHHTEETKRKISIANKGKKRTEETKMKISITLKKNPPKMAYKSGHVPWMKGKSMSEEQKKKHSLLMKGRLIWNKGKKGMMPIPWNKDIPFSEESKKKMSESSKGQKAWNKGKHYTEETREKIRKARIGKKHKSETRQKLRIINLNKMKENIKIGAQLTPFYNRKACEYFKQFDEVNNTEGQYATNGGELCVLGYWLDYVNHSMKIIIEWDEENHHYINGKLREKDMIKQKEIEIHFPDYTFIRIREAEYIPKANELFPRLVENGI